MSRTARPALGDERHPLLESLMLGRRELAGEVAIEQQPLWGIVGHVVGGERAIA